MCYKTTADKAPFVLCYYQLSAPFF